MITATAAPNSRDSTGLSPAMLLIPAASPVTRTNSTTITASRTPAGHTRRVGSHGDWVN
ncbi:hypothetical protein [Streptomyces sp. OV198]|uniref:hypothetical protein n=1 Tax=Streptomyces sp. OV198 TaxID=1882787 RepID=UPI0015CF8023|nr:hypothetical protein [Streptomyces sp. OV198]